MLPHKQEYSVGVMTLEVLPVGQRIVGGGSVVKQGATQDGLEAGDG